MAEVTFDYQNMMEVEGGLGSGELDEIQPRLREAAEELLGNPPGFMRLPPRKYGPRGPRTLSTSVSGDPPWDRWPCTRR
jgi:hypothetical protein